MTAPIASPLLLPVWSLATLDEADRRAPALAENDIHLWQFGLDRPQQEVRCGALLLSEDEQARAARFRSPVLTARFVIGRAVLREVLARYCGCAPAGLCFSTMHTASPRSMLRIFISICRIPRTSRSRRRAAADRRRRRAPAADPRRARHCRALFLPRRSDLARRIAAGRGRAGLCVVVDAQGGFAQGRRQGPVAKPRQLRFVWSARRLD